VGLGEEGSTGIPTRKGSTFFGYLNQYTRTTITRLPLAREKRFKVDNPQSKVENVAEKFNAYAPDLFLADAFSS